MATGTFRGVAKTVPKILAAAAAAMRAAGVPEAELSAR
eukprot:CAMPEP_0182932490 /NCGR_PEP_ID=MMETSP0105_2-20130417/31422_1 /TAXON_ID=81532 ORGANISM="Acanthoeca-like sp., Strain 10tr" /NCGR_SAMPLE_ID=MMETSP0105_2 /ASSEMBLY_ACC=CAM_ASM_000205 /LENGTH=37 /DNA_ID= /DNA_START= /DNA_END= /DNA_ORIENTATION=